MQPLLWIQRIGPAASINTDKSLWLRSYSPLPEWPQSSRDQTVLCLALGSFWWEHLYTKVLLAKEPVRKPDRCSGSLLEPGEPVCFWHHMERGKSKSFLKWFERGSGSGHGRAVWFTLVARRLAGAPGRCFLCYCPHFPQCILNTSRKCCIWK